jgi:hypothetical protein
MVVNGLEADRLGLAWTDLEMISSKLLLIPSCMTDQFLLINPSQLIQKIHLAKLKGKQYQ